MKDLRSFIEAWRKQHPEETIVVKDEVDPKYEIAAVVKKLDTIGRSPLLIFENVKGYNIPVVCNVAATNEQLCFALDAPLDNLLEWYNSLEEQVLAGSLKKPPVEVASGPVKDVVIVGDKVDLRRYPFLHHHTGEVPYLTRAIGITLDPETGLPHAGAYRLMVKGKDLMVTHVTPGRHLWHILKKAEAMGRPLPIAFSIGNHPAWSMGAQARIAHPPTEYDIIGALLGEGLAVVKCETSNVPVPAYAEMIIEGELRPGVLEDEGPWTDFTRYSQVAQRHPVFVTAITHRKDMWLHDSEPWLASASDAYHRVPQTAYMRREIRKAVPSVREFRFAFAPSPMYGVVSLDKTHEGEPKQAILAAFANDLYLKYVIAVDTDINLDNPKDITWALATRVQADRDFLILKDVLGTDLDISAPREAIVTKVGIDATAKPFRKDLPPAGQVPEEIVARIDVEKLLRSAGAAD